MVEKGKKGSAINPAIKAEWVTPHLVEVGGSSGDWPEDVEKRPGVVSGVPFEWVVQKPGEGFKSVIVRRINTMSLGGSAYVLESQLANGPAHILLKKGGKVLDSRVKEIGVREGDEIAIQFLGEDPPTEKGYSPMRQWRVKLFAPSTT